MLFGNVVVIQCLPPDHSHPDSCARAIPSLYAIVSQELVPQLVESYMVLLSTRPGSMSAAMCAAHGGAKERKRMMRAIKGYVATSLMHR